MLELENVNKLLGEVNRLKIKELNAKIDILQSNIDMLVSLHTLLKDVLHNRDDIDSVKKMYLAELDERMEGKISNAKKMLLTINQEKDYYGDKLVNNLSKIDALVEQQIKDIKGTNYYILDAQRRAGFLMDMPIDLSLKEDYIKSLSAVFDAESNCRNIHVGELVDAELSLVFGHLHNIEQLTLKALDIKNLPSEIADISNRLVLQDNLVRKKVNDLVKLRKSDEKCDSIKNEIFQILLDAEQKYNQLNEFLNNEELSQS